MDRRVGKFRFDAFKITEAYFCSGSEIILFCPYYKPGNR